MDSGKLSQGHLPSTPCYSGLVLYYIRVSPPPLQLPNKIAITAFYITGHLLFLTATGNVPPLREILPVVFAYQNYYDAVRPHQPYTPFHILWPCALVLHALIIRRLYQQNMLVWGILLGCVSWRIALFAQGAVDVEYLSLATDTRLDSVVWGVLLGRLLQKSTSSTQRILSHPPHIRHLYPVIMRHIPRKRCSVQSRATPHIAGYVAPPDCMANTKCQSVLGGCFVCETPCSLCHVNKLRVFYLALCSRTRHGSSHSPRARL
jgi:hypothetical protein